MSTIDFPSQRQHRGWVGLAGAGKNSDTAALAFAFQRLTETLVRILGIDKIAVDAAQGGDKTGWR